jgi:hypothetical protein
MQNKTKTTKKNKQKSANINGVELKTLPAIILFFLSLLGSV